MYFLRIFALFALLACLINNSMALPVVKVIEVPVVTETSSVSDSVQAVPISLIDVEGDARTVTAANVELQRSARGLGLGFGGLGNKFGGLGLGHGFKGFGGVFGGLGFGGLHGLGGGFGFKPLFNKFG